MKCIKWLDDHLEETLLVIALVLISCIELLQVVIRNVPFIPALTWAEEFCRFCWIWSVFLSLPYTISKSSMLRVTVLMDLFPSKIRSIINIFVNLITAAVMLFLGINSISVVGKIMSSSETSPAMGWAMWIVYSVMLAGFFLGTLRALQQVVLHICAFNEKQLSATEQTMVEASEEVEAGRKAERGTH